MKEGNGVSKRGSKSEGRSFLEKYGFWLLVLPLIIILFVFFLPRISSLINSLVVYGQGKGATTVFLVLGGLMTLCAGLPLPGFMFLVFAAGILYGVFYGFLMAYGISFVASCSWFLFYRNCCGKAVVKYFGAISERTKLWLELAEKDGIRIVFLVKMLPFGGGGTANVLFAVLTKVSLFDFAAGLSIAHLKFLLFTFVSSSAGSLANLHPSPSVKPANAQYKQRSRTLHVVMGTVGALVLIALCWWAYKTYSEIERQLDETERRRKEAKNTDKDSTKETDRLLGGASV